jgi:hypothetical protein
MALIFFVSFDGFFFLDVFYVFVVLVDVASREMLNILKRHVGCL